MISIFQILGVLISTFYMLGVYLWTCKECNEFKENEPCPIWIVVTFMVAVLVLGISLGTIIMSTN